MEKGDSLSMKIKNGKGEVQVKEEIQKQQRGTAPMHLQHFKTELVTSSSSALLFDHYDSIEAANIPVTADDDRFPLTSILHHHLMNEDKFYESAILSAAATA